MGEQREGKAASRALVAIFGIIIIAALAVFFLIYRPEIPALNFNIQRERDRIIKKFLRKNVINVKTTIGKAVAPIKISIFISLEGIKGAL